MSKMKTFYKINILFLLAVLISPSCGQKFSFKPCPTTITSVTTITYAQLATTLTWRVYARTPSIHTHYWECTTWTITEVTANVLYTVTVQARKKVTGELVTYTGTIAPGGAAAAAASVATSFLTISFTNTYVTKSINYYMIAGVTPDYVVLYSCQSVLWGRLESVIILISSTATPAQIQTALNAVSNYGYPLHALKRDYQNCLT